MKLLDSLIAEKLEIFKEYSEEVAFSYPCLPGILLRNRALKEYRSYTIHLTLSLLSVIPPSFDGNSCWAKNVGTGDNHLKKRGSFLSMVCEI